MNVNGRVESFTFTSASTGHVPGFSRRRAQSFTGVAFNAAFPSFTYT